MENRTLNITFKKPRYHENPRKKKKSKKKVLRKSRKTNRISKKRVPIKTLYYN